MASWQEVLITAVASRPCLWDTTHKDYKDVRGVRNNNWSDICDEVKEVTKMEFSGDLIFYYLLS